MSKIHEAFENGKAFIAFVTGGDPDLDTTKKIIKEMEKAGADLIEIGIPFPIQLQKALLFRRQMRERWQMDVQPINCLTH